MFWTVESNRDVDVGVVGENGVEVVNDVLEVIVGDMVKVSCVVSDELLWIGVVEVANEVDVE